MRKTTLIFGVMGLIIIGIIAYVGFQFTPSKPDLRIILPTSKVATPSGEIATGSAIPATTSTKKKLTPTVTNVASVSSSHIKISLPATPSAFITP